jgi:hypothetical protein
MTKIYTVLVLFLLLCVPVFAQSPKIVAHVDLINQTNTIPATALLTPPSSGLYRVSAYMDVTSYTQSGSIWYLNIGWTDTAGHRSKQFAVQQTPNHNGPTWAEGTVVAGDVAGRPLNYSVTLDGEDYAPFDLFITVEQLQ